MLHKPLFLLCAALAGSALAAELGEVAPHSYIGQPLAVDIELGSLTAEEVAQGVQVRLALPDVYRGANVAMNPALSTVKMAVLKRGQKTVLQVSTTRPVDADYVHLYVELGVPGKQEVRLATVWLQRDPNPPPPPEVAAAAAPLTPARAEQVLAEVRAARSTGGKAGMASAATGSAGTAGASSASAGGATASGDAGARSGTTARERGRPAPLPSVHEAETGQPGEVKAAAQTRKAAQAAAGGAGVAGGAGETPERIAGVWVSPSGTPLKPSVGESVADSAVPTGVAQALMPLPPLPLPKGVKRPAPQSCAPTGMSAKECVALDHHNTELNTKLSELEDKLKLLQGALKGAAPTAAARPTTAQANGQAATHGATAAAAGQPASQATAHGATAAATGQPVAQANARGAMPVVKTTPQGVAQVGAAGGSAVGGAAAQGTAGPGVAPAKTEGSAKTPAASSAAASLSAQGEVEAHAAKAIQGAATGGSAEAASAAVSGGDGVSAAGAAASAASVPTKKVRVLPKLKYKKGKPPEEAGSSALPLAIGGAGLLALLGTGFIWWRRRNVGRGPLQIWQGFRKKKAAEPEQEFKPVEEPVAESVSP